LDRPPTAPNKGNFEAQEIPGRRRCLGSMKITILFSFGRLMLLAFVLATQTSRAVILFGSGDPSYNTTPPAGALQGSGWQYEGQWGIFLGTPIAPQYFIAAHHVGGAVGQTFVFNGVNYTTTAYWDDPDTDLRIWKINGTFPIYAPLYATNDEAGKTLVVIGRGSQRGDPVLITEAQTVNSTNVVDLDALGITKKAAMAAFPNATFQKHVIMSVVTPVYTTNVVNLNTLGIPKKAAQVGFPEAKFQGAVMTVVTPVYTTNVVNLTTLGISKRAAQAEFPNATFQGAIMTVVTPVYTTNVLDLTALGISQKAAQKEFRNATFKDDLLMSVVTSDLVTNTVLKGWQNGPGDGVMRWGQNKVFDAGYYLKVAYTGTNGPNEGFLSGGDSSGAVFIQNNSVWQLAAINYAVDGPFSTSLDGSTFYGAIFDMNNLYFSSCYMPKDGVTRNAHYYATRISSRVSWIQSIISQ
jgi:hypothetical protein